jgi:HAD superfamily hydrolase (TIGR01493 family)
MRRGGNGRFHLYFAARRGPKLSDEVSHKRFDAVLIDFYGTICAGDKQAVENACKRIVDHFGLPTTAAQFAITWGERFFATIENSNHDGFRSLYECEISSLQETLRPIVGEFDPRPFVADLEAYWADPDIHPDAVQFLDGVKVPVCCVSNADVEPLARAIAKHGLKFHAVVASQEVRCYKPEPEIFRAAISILGTDAARVMHIGDSLHSDIGGATRMGITATWICREHRIHDIGTTMPHFEVRSLTEVHDLLG